METGRSRTDGSGGSRRPERDDAGRDGAAWADGEHDGAGQGYRRTGGVLAAEHTRDRPDSYRGRRAQGPDATDAQRDPQRPSSEPRQPRASARSGGNGPVPEPPVARRTTTGWRVGDEEVSDLTSAMVLADLLAADLPAEGPPTPGSRAASDRAERAGRAGRGGPAEEPDIRQLQETVAQLEHALAVRVRVEQAIGVLAERHRMRPRQAFELLRSAARARGKRVLEVAGDVVDSATNPLLRIPEELAKPPASRRRGRMSRRSPDDD